MTARRSEPLLLDTCVLIYLANGLLTDGPAQESIREAGRSGSALVSPISAWEIGLLSRQRRAGGVKFAPDPRTWFAAVMASSGLRLAAFTPEMAIDASRLPEPLHGDPADRILIATARHLSISLVTSDTKILTYAATGHLQVIAC